jgi:hypothetical protein
MIVLLLPLLAFCAQDARVRQYFAGSWYPTGDPAAGTRQICSANEVGLGSIGSGFAMASDGDGGFLLPNSDVPTGFRCPQEHFEVKDHVATADPGQSCTLNDGGTLIVVLSDQLTLSDDEQSLSEQGSFIVVNDDGAATQSLSGCGLSVTQTLVSPALGCSGI